MEISYNKKIDQDWVDFFITGINFYQLAKGLNPLMVP
jgi:hypothetical protein